MAFWSYYGSAVTRSAAEAITWVLGQGILLSLLSLVGLLVVGILYAVLRALHRQHTWRDAMSNIVSALRDFVVAAVAGTAVVMLILFAVFFVRDAPKQIAALNQHIADAGAESIKKDKDNHAALEALKQSYEAAADGLQNKVGSLAHEVDVLKKQMASDLRVVAEPAVADVSGGFKTHIVLQTGHPAQPFSIRMEFDNVVAKCEWHFDAGRALVMSSSYGPGVTLGPGGCAGKMFGITLEAPAFIPDTPLIVDVSSATPINVIGGYFGR